MRLMGATAPLTHSRVVCVQHIDYLDTIFSCHAVVFGSMSNLVFTRNIVNDMVQM
jgi:hypothetical protein